MQCKCYKVYEGYIEFNSAQCRKTKNNFPKKPVENADLHKPVWNKIMTTHE